MATPVRHPSVPVAVVGLGTMGTGIAEVLVRAGRDVIGIDIGSEAAAAQAVAALEASTARAVRRERLSEQERADALPCFRTFTDLAAAADADLVIEVTPESYDIKQQVFRALDGIVRPDTILATGTNALSVTRLAAQLGPPQRVLGLHFFNPAPAMKLVEVVSSAPLRPRPSPRSPTSRSTSARSPSRSATAPDSWPTGCCSATSTRPPRCTRRNTPPARTSTPR